MKLFVHSILLVTCLLVWVDAQNCALCPSGVGINSDVVIPNPDPNDDTVFTCDTLVTIAGLLNASSTECMDIQKV